MAENAPGIADDQRTALLRSGIVVLESALDARPPYLLVSGAGEARVRRIVAKQLGAEVDVGVLGSLPREIVPRRCVGQMEREEGRLQLRFVLCGNEHVDDIVVAEDEECVVVFATVCTAVAGESGQACEGPWHVYLDRPLGGRAVIDGTSGERIPYKNIYAELIAEGLALPPPDDDDPLAA